MKNNELSDKNKQCELLIKFFMVKLNTKEIREIYDSGTSFQKWNSVFEELTEEMIKNNLC